jgi:large subunit ribosomal protein L9
MEIILIENIKNVGKLGDVATVAGGYARNYLIPYGKAVPATKDNLQFFENKRAELEAKAADRLSQAQKRAESFTGMVLSIEALASDEGKLYGSVHVHEVVAHLKEKGLSVNRSEILMGQPIRDLGTYPIKLQLHPDVLVDLTLEVVAAAKPAS